MNAKPYATRFTFDPKDGTICYEDELGTACRIADVPDYDDPRQAATARLLADAPGMVGECLEALLATYELLFRHAQQTKHEHGSDLAKICAAITKAEALLKGETGKTTL